VKRVAIIGGGITGLAAAFRLGREAPELRVSLFEREGRLGGKIATDRKNGFVLEDGADSFLSRKLRGVGLCLEAGIAGELIGRRPEHARTFVKRGGALHRLPEGLTGMIPTNLAALSESSLLSPAGRERVKEEPTVPAANDASDESIARFIARRFGREAYDYLVEPLMSGIYAGDGELLSIDATFPLLREFERRHRSVLKGLAASKVSESDGGGYPAFVAFADGMESLVQAIAGQLAAAKITTECGVAAIEESADSGYRLVFEKGDSEVFDGVIIATPAHVTARLTSALDPDLSRLHAAIPYASSAIVNLVYNERDMPPAVEGYGYIVPRAENTDVLACTVTSNKWPGRTPPGFAALRVYIGRYGGRDVVRDSDDALINLARGELKETFRIDSAPHMATVRRWAFGMPQYTIGHLERLASIDTCVDKHPGLCLAGAAYRGVGIPDCIASGETAARTVMKFIQPTRRRAT
jgi:oxygen-dependent protoporphyrinogen oxidase